MGRRCADKDNIHQRNNHGEPATKADSDVFKMGLRMHEAEKSAALGSIDADLFFRTDGRHGAG